MLRTRKDIVLSNIALVVLGIVCGFFLAECLVRIIRPQQVYLTEAPGIFFIRHDPLLGWVNREGADGIYSPDPEIPRTSVRINTQGNRGQLVSGKKTGQRRILFLGDSNTFGYGVEENQRFSNIVTTRLGSGFEAVNMGVFGYSTDQQALQLESRGGDFRPDAVILAISAGDLSEVMTSVSGGAAKPYFRFFGDRLMVQNTPVPEKSPYMKSISLGSRTKRFCYNHSHLYRLVLSRLMNTNMYMPNAVKEMKEADGLNVMTALIGGMRDICQENGVSFVAILIPHGVWLEGMRHNPGSMPGYFGVLKRRLEADRVEVLDLTASLMEAMLRGEQVFFAKDPVHLTQQGNSLVAEILLPWISSRVLKR